MGKPRMMGLTVIHRWPPTDISTVSDRAVNALMAREERLRSGHPDTFTGEILTAWTVHEVFRKARARLRRLGLGRLPLDVAVPTPYVRHLHRSDKYFCILGVLPEQQYAFALFVGAERKKLRKGIAEAGSRMV